MSENSAKLLSQLVSAKAIKEIDHWIAKYPKEQRQSAVMSALMIVQEELGFLTEALMDAVADYLHMPPVAVYEVATFYSMYELQPTGKHTIYVCTNISCKLRNSAAIVEHLENRLGVKLGETSKDARFSLKNAECLGACVNAPMMQINKTYHENLTPEKVDEILEQYP